MTVHGLVARHLKSVVLSRPVSPCLALSRPRCRHLPLAFQRVRFLASKTPSASRNSPLLLVPRINSSRFSRSIIGCPPAPPPSQSPRLA